MFVFPVHWHLVIATGQVDNTEVLCPCHVVDYFRKVERPALFRTGQIGAAYAEEESPIMCCSCILSTSLLTSALQAV